MVVGKTASASEKILLKEEESARFELHLAELKKDKSLLNKQIEQLKENHAKKYQLLKEKQSELRKKF